MCVFFLAPLIRKARNIILLFDAFGLGVFTAIGAAKGAEMGLTFIGIILSGVITAVGGGMIRDIMSGRIPAVLTSDFLCNSRAARRDFILCTHQNNESSLFLGISDHYGIRYRNPPSCNSLQTAPAGIRRGGCRIFSAADTKKISRETEKQVSGKKPWKKQSFQKRKTGMRNGNCFPPFSVMKHLRFLKKTLRENRF
jgi:hypothetical protein